MMSGVVMMAAALAVTVTPAIQTIPPFAPKTPGAVHLPATLEPAPVQSQAQSAAKAVLDRYEARIALAHTPAIMTFEYTVEQAGERSLTQAHRIYRNANVERDETYNGDEAKGKPHIRIFRNRPNAYAFENVAPRKDLYTFNYVGKIKIGNRANYVFHTTPISHLSAFAVTEVVIDAQQYLPSKIAFTTMSAVASGTGSLRYSEVDGAWVIAEAEASALMAKKNLRAHFVFTNYHFPKSLPASTFGSY